MPGCAQNLAHGSAPLSFLQDHLLTALVFLPLASAAALLTFPRGEHTGARGFALGASLLNLALAAWLWSRFDAGQPGLQFVESAAWIPALGIRYALGLDGLTLPLVLLTTFLTPCVLVSAYSSVTERPRGFVACVLGLQSCVLGAFCASDMVLFYVFWEGTLVPVLFLLGLWGSGRRTQAALKFALYTLAGSLLMLAAMVCTAYAVRDVGAGGLTFGWSEVAERLQTLPPGASERWLFLAFALAFAIKIPLFPWHTWQPDAYAAAPTAAAVLMASILVKLGTFGFLRYALWLFPRTAAEFMPTVATVATVGVLYGACVAMAQSDLRRLVAYASMSHLGTVMLGMMAMTPTSLAGSVVQMVSHGVSTGALLLLVGTLQARRQSCDLADFGGAARAMPLACALFVLMAMSALNLPGLNGFVGEFLILTGTFQSTSHPAFPWLAVASAVSVVLAPGYMLWAVQRVFFGPMLQTATALRDLRLSETLALAPLAVVVVAMGVYPQPFLDKINPSVQRYAQDFRVRAQLPEAPVAPQRPQPPVLTPRGRDLTWRGSPPHEEATLTARRSPSALPAR